MVAQPSVLQKRPACDSREQIIATLASVYGRYRMHRIMLSAREMESLESTWDKRWKREIDDLTAWLIDKAARTATLDIGAIDFDSIAMEHSLAVMEQALRDSVDILPRVPSDPTRLAEKKKKATPPPKARVPTSFKALRILWDKYRKMKYIPPRQRSIAARVKKAYLKRVQAEWVKHGEKFRSGDVAVRAEAVEAIKSGAAVAYQRAKMIVETETTYYYNKTRRAVFDQSADVTHYLFMAIRDHRTTEWCKSRQGLVYAKDDPLLKSETPPCHWNCRSEILPLTELNPRHKAMIDDPARQRRNHKCKPLPDGWEGR